MNTKQFNTIKKSIKAYMKSLTLDECKTELVKKGVLKQNSKTKKGEKLNFGLELLPSVLSGANLCPSAGKCKLTCLAFSGAQGMIYADAMFKGEMINSQLKMLARRTFVYLNDREWFLKLLKAELNHRTAMTELLGQGINFRLNVFSDIDWRFLTDELTHISFYDYTKVWTRKSTPNYPLTFSASEMTDNFSIFEKVSNGENVAVVFEVPSKLKLPTEFLNLEVVSGEETDNRYDDPRGVIVGLVYKSTSGGKQSTEFAFKSVA
jgi:hypothetical protein